MRVKIRWLGHACFRIESADGTVLLTDPYDESVPYKPPEGPAHVVLVTHEHFDHNAVDRVQGSPEVIRGTGEQSAHGITFRGIPAFHDAEGGRQRGHDVIFRFTLDDVVLAHFGDLGHSLTDEQRKPLEEVEVAFLPVGGHFTIGAKEAVDVAKALPNLKVLIPMHYRTDAIPDWPIRPLDEFLAASPFAVTQLKKPEVELSRVELPRRPEVWVLHHA
ncbi:MAG: MBL fold metallo-hydrolase [Candidatus Bipolaricaulota bacterium]